MPGIGAKDKLYIFLIINDSITGGVYVTSLVVPLISVSLYLIYNLILEGTRRLEMIEEFS